MDIVNLVVYAGGPALIASFIAYWSIRAGKNKELIENKEASHLE